MARLLGIDPGQRRVGLALTDEERVLTRPLRIVDRKEENLREILKQTIEEHDVETVIVGYPTPLQSKENERTRQVDQFIEEYIEDLVVPYETISERYTTREATRFREERGQKGEANDAEAAALILQHYLRSSND